ncbi:hypothetical protein, partial [Streptomyces sp. NPDC005568]|uniref:hypothetical protein n=1 Tax=Streptomyces sp. NPDC005568 TaxID=3156887 RepID=UPI0033A9BB61
MRSSTSHRRTSHTARRRATAAALVGVTALLTAAQKLLGCQKSQGVAHEDRDARIARFTQPSEQHR